MSLSKKERDALPDSDFAVPGKRKLPINDKRHVKLAESMLDRTEGLTPEEKKIARERILRKAKQLGMDTSNWDNVKAAAELLEMIEAVEYEEAEGVEEVALEASGPKFEAAITPISLEPIEAPIDRVRSEAMAIEAMSLNIANSGHINKMPFSGILTRIGTSSDKPPGGAAGRYVVVTMEAAEAALPSLLGMAVDYTPFYDGHDSQAKIGIITSAIIEGNAIVIEGFVYASDFPEQAAFIREHKDVLGFSFEADEIWVSDPNADPLNIVACTFTGAAILRKDKAAYQSTSIAASAEKADIDMTKEEMLALLGEVLAPLSARFDSLEASAKADAEAIKALAAKAEAPKASEAPAVDPKVAALEAKVAELTAAAEKSSADAVAAAVAEATKSLKDELASMTTKIEDVKAAARKESEAPARKTIAPHLAALIARAGLELPAAGADKLTASAVDEALAKANIRDTATRITVKRELERHGAL
jgi:hypothetical protein